ncbi:MAG: hypothetical protein ABUT20_48105, partial [Bacteroidota bacterium]
KQMKPANHLQKIYSGSYSAYQNFNNMATTHEPASKSWHILAADTKTRIMRLLQWNELQYAEFQFAQGLKYLDRYIPGDAAGIEMLQRNKLFWSWWKNHWMQRDNQFIKAKHKDSLVRMVQLYKYTHSVPCLINEIYPSAAILGNDYCRMIGQVNDKIIK